MCEKEKRPTAGASASGRFHLRKMRNGEFAISLTLFDHGDCPERFQAQTAMIQEFLSALQSGQCRLAIGRLFVDTSPLIRRADYQSLNFEVPAKHGVTPDCEAQVRESQSQGCQ